MKKPFMSAARREAIKRDHAARAAARRRGQGTYANPLTDPANPASVYYGNADYSTGSGEINSSSSGSDYGSRSDTSYGSTYGSTDSSSSGGGYGE